MFYNVMGEVVVDGRKIFRLSYDRKANAFFPRFFSDFSENIPSFKGSDLARTLKANEHILKDKEREALIFLRKTIKKFSYLPLAVSFSGGKDSAATLALTRLVKRKFDAIFLNTTIEFDETVEYVREIAKLWRINLIEAKPPQDFFQLCNELGPPSTKMKWCCKTQKFSPQNQLINERYPNGVLVISGIRKQESNIRSRFNRIQRNKMIPKQVLAFPILNWSSLDVWLYLFWKKIPYNKMYNYGFARIGCWACPEKSLRDFKLVEYAHPDLIERLNNLLENYAEQIQIVNPKDWVQSGKWRFRKTKWTKTIACRSAKLCSLGNEIVYTFSNLSGMDRVKEFTKIFGNYVEKGKMVKIVNPRIEITIIGNRMHVKIKNPDIFPVLEKQITRALNCVGCGACVGICNAGALRVEAGILKISDECTGCLQCAKSNGIRMSCVSVNYRPQILSVT
jgi:phosphoadenosine phosphosulfate reductase